jgi:3',5'-cyclic-AMP phosphodiesterase
MSKIVHLTDLHLTPLGRSLYDIDPNARLEAAIADINPPTTATPRWSSSPATSCMVGEPASYAALRRALEELQRLRLLMGNHDDRASFRAAFSNHPVHAAGFIQAVCETPAGAFVLIDTLDPGTDGGRLCPARLAWLEATLRELEGRPAFLAMHHPPVPLGIPILDSIALLEPRALSDLITRCEDVTIRHIFCGHVHRLTHGAWRGIPFSAQRSLICQFAATLAPKDDRLVGSYEHPAYSIALIETDSIAIHVREFLDESPRFDPAEADTRARHRSEKKIGDSRLRLIRELERFAYSDTHDVVQWERRPRLDDDGNVVGFVDELIPTPSRLLTQDQAAQTRSVTTKAPAGRSLRSPDRQASLERRRRQAMSGVVPAKIAASFTMGDLAVPTVIARQCQRAGVCTLHIDAIAALAGCSRTSVKNALRQARLLGLILVKERRIPGLPSLTNIVSIISKDWIGWLKLGEGSKD